VQKEFFSVGLAAKLRHPSSLAKLHAIVWTNNICGTRRNTDSIAGISVHISVLLIDFIGELNISKIEFF